MKNVEGIKMVEFIIKNRIYNLADNPEKLLSKKLTKVRKKAFGLVNQLDETISNEEQHNIIVKIEDAFCDLEDATEDEYYKKGFFDGVALLEFILSKNKVNIEQLISAKGGISNENQ